MYLYDGDTVITNDDLELRAYDAHKLIGGIQERYCNYKIVDGKPDISDYSFTNVIQARCLGAVGDLSMIGGLELLTKIMDFKGASSVYESGAFAVSGSYKTIADMDLIPWDNSRGIRRWLLANYGSVINIMAVLTDWPHSHGLQIPIIFLDFPPPKRITKPD